MDILESCPSRRRLRRCSSCDLQLGQLGTNPRSR
jgi:hypothetical protein